MLDSGTTSESSSWFGRSWFGRSVVRRLLVTLICGTVAAGTGVAVHRAADPAPARTTATGREQSRVPPLDPTPSSDPEAVGADQVPLRPAAVLEKLLTTRSSAIRSGDQAAWLAGLAPAS